MSNRIKFLSALYKSFFLAALVFFDVYPGIAETIDDIKDPSKKTLNDNKQVLIKSALEKKINPGVYLLGPGDILEISIEGLPELSGAFEVGPEGNIYLPQLNSINVEGFSIEELREDLLIKYDQFLISPKIFLNVLAFRPVRVYVSGEVARPGYYFLKGRKDISKISSSLNNSMLKLNNQNNLSFYKNTGSNKNFNAEQGNYFPTVFDAIRVSRGITPFSNLEKIIVIRNTSKNYGNQKIQSELNFLSLIKEGDQSQNIRIYDGDSIKISRSNTILKDQILNANKTNLSPDYIEVYVTGNVEKPGSVLIPQGSGLTQAIAISGGKKILSGKIEFFRFYDDGDFESRRFSYSPKSKLNSSSNPILMSGDIIHVKNSLLGYSSQIVGKVSEPLIGIYSINNLFFKD